MIRRHFSIAVFCFAAFMPGAVCWADDSYPPAPDHFVHPGIFTSQAELAVIQAAVAAKDGSDPIYAGFMSTTQSKFGNVDFVPQPVAHVKRGDRKPHDSPVLQRDSAMTAYTLSLKWATTGDAAARDKAIAIMDAWANTFVSEDGDMNRFLDASWVLAPWCAAGELMAHATVEGKGSGWSAAEVATFKGMIQKISRDSVPIFDPKYAPGNWQTSAGLGAMEAGVFLDDPALYAQGRNYILKYMPRVLLKEGYCNEIFRDPWHGIVSLTGVMEAAEVGRHQGDRSIYHARYDGQADPRILVCIRWYAKPLMGTPVDVPPMGGPKWKPKPWQFVADTAAHSTGGWEMALNFYKNVEPSADLDEFEKAVISKYRPSGQDNSLFIESDSWTQGELNSPKRLHPLQSP